MWFRFARSRGGLCGAAARGDGHLVAPASRGIGGEATLLAASFTRPPLARALLLRLALRPTGIARMLWQSHSENLPEELESKVRQCFIQPYGCPIRFTGKRKN